MKLKFLLAYSGMCAIACSAALAAYTPVPNEALSIARTDNFFIQQSRYTYENGEWVSSNSPTNGEWYNYDAYNQNFINNTHIRGITDYDDGISQAVLKQVESLPDFSHTKYDSRAYANKRWNRAYDVYMHRVNNLRENIVPLPLTSGDTLQFKVQDRNFAFENTPNIYAYQQSYSYVFPEDQKEELSNRYREYTSYDKAQYDGVEFVYTQYTYYDGQDWIPWENPDRNNQNDGWLVYPIDTSLQYTGLSLDYADDTIQMNASYDPIQRTVTLTGEISGGCYNNVLYNVIEENGALDQIQVVFDTTQESNREHSIFGTCEHTSAQETTQSIYWTFNQVDITKYQEQGFVGEDSLTAFFENDDNLLVSVNSAGTVSEYGEVSFLTYEESGIQCIEDDFGGSCTSSSRIVPMNLVITTARDNFDILPEDIITTFTSSDITPSIVELPEGQYSVFKAQEDDSFVCQDVDTAGNMCTFNVTNGEVTSVQFIYTPVTPVDNSSDETGDVVFTAQTTSGAQCDDFSCASSSAPAELDLLITEKIMEGDTLDDIQILHTVTTSVLEGVALQLPVGEYSVFTKLDDGRLECQFTSVNGTRCGFEVVANAETSVSFFLDLSQISPNENSEGNILYPVSVYTSIESGGCDQNTCQSSSRPTQLLYAIFPVIADGETPQVEDRIGVYKTNLDGYGEIELPAGEYSIFGYEEIDEFEQYSCDRIFNDVLCGFVVSADNSNSVSYAKKV